MRADIRGMVGPQFLSDGVQQRIRSGKGGELITSRLHGTYTEQSYRGNVFVVTSIMSDLIPNLSTNAPSVSFFNPRTSNVLCSLIRVEIALSTAPVTPAIAAYALQILTKYSADPTQAPVVAFPGVTGSTFVPNGKMVRAATYTGSTVTLYRLMANHFTGAITTIPNMPTYAVDFDGTCLLSPGNAISPAQTNNDATNANIFTSVIWEEIPL